jgi:hypothetical protein
MSTIELNISVAIQSWIAIGLTVWLLDSPDRVWPFFALGYPAAGVLAVSSFLVDDWSFGIFGSLAALPLAGAGWWVIGMGYPILGWICIAIGVLYLVAALTSAAAAFLKRK